MLATLLISQTGISEQKVVFEKLDNLRLIVLTDIENEPDDDILMVHLMTYANVLVIEGLVATTSCWQRNAFADWHTHEVGDTYGKVRDNLLKHESSYPSLKHIKGHIKKGVSAFAGNTSQDIVHIKVKPEETVELSAAGKHDSDGDNVTYQGFVYPEVGSYKTAFHRNRIEIKNPEAQQASFIAPKVDSPEIIHFILEVKDDGNPRFL